MVRASREDAQNDAGAASVIATVMLVALAVIVGVVAARYAVPALRTQHEGTDMAAANEQLRALATALSDLTSGPPSHQAARWSPAVSKGALVLHPKGEVWIIVNDRKGTIPAVNLSVGIGPGATPALVFADANGGPAGVTLRVHRIFAGTRETLLPASQPDCTGIPGAWTAGKLTTYLCRVGSATASGRVDIGADPLQVELLRGSTVLAEAWSIDVGSLDETWYRSDATESLSLINGGLIKTVDATRVVETAPLLPPPRALPRTAGGGDVASFVHLMRWNGNVSRAGVDRGDLLVKETARDALTVLPCGDATATCAQDLRIEMLSPRAAAWQKFLSGDARMRVRPEVLIDPAGGTPIRSVYAWSSNGLQLRTTLSTIDISGE